MPIPDCERGESGLIVAQSVPTAELVPCFTPLPAGWSRSTVEIDETGSVVRLDSDRAGEGAATLTYVESCDVGEAVPVPTDQEMADRLDYIERVEPGFRATRFYVFDGGCVWWEFDFEDDASAALSVELGNSLVLLSRQSLNDNIRESFIDEEL